MTTVIVAIVIFSCMIAEARVSAAHDRALRAMGAVEPAADVYRVMQVAYPGVFLAELAEAAVRGEHGWGWVATAGVVLFVLAKALKYWAIACLGVRWTFRVLVPPGQPRLVRGPYRWLRHPNYVAVAGELSGAALWLRAPLMGTLGTLFFVALMRRRIAVEEQALAEYNSRTLDASASLGPPV